MADSDILPTDTVAPADVVPSDSLATVAEVVVDNAPVVDLSLRTPGELAAAQAARNETLNLVDAALSKMPQVACPVCHRFTPGLYSREVLMFKGMVVTSKIHKTEHQFLIVDGDVSVWTEHEGIMRLRTGDVGRTTPGTRRVLFMHEHTRWITFHPTDKTTVEEVESDIIYPHTPENDELYYSVVAALQEGAAK